jgi:hypothetical protein
MLTISWYTARMEGNLRGSLRLELDGASRQGTEQLFAVNGRSTVAGFHFATVASGAHNYTIGKQAITASNREFGVP